MVILYSYFFQKNWKLKILIFFLILKKRIKNQNCFIQKSDYSKNIILRRKHLIYFSSNASHIPNFNNDWPSQKNIWKIEVVINFTFVFILKSTWLKWSWFVMKWKIAVFSLKCWFLKKNSVQYQWPILGSKIWDFSLWYYLKRCVF